MANVNYYKRMLMLLMAVSFVSLMVTPESVIGLIESKAIAAVFGWLAYVKYQQWKAAGLMNDIEKLATE